MLPRGADTTVRVTVRGVVLNDASGEPVPRALIRMTGETSAGALTDGEGRYELEGVPTGPQQISVIKPGFLDVLAEAASSGGGFTREFAHTVMVAAEMPDVTFRMEPVNAIYGRVRLSTGDAASGIDIMLLRQTVLSGRFSWQIVSSTRTNAEGAYRFGSLPDGAYAIHSAPAMESEIFDLAHAVVERGGYPLQFYPDARDLASAAKIQLRGGEQTEADLALTLETFHPVSASVSVPTDAAGQEFSADGEGATLSAVVADSQGHAFFYPAQYDSTSHTVRALLPDGTYTLIVTAAWPTRGARRNAPANSAREANPDTGAVEFSVNGHAVTNLRIGLASAARSPVQVSVTRSGGSASAAAQNVDAHEIVLTLSEAGGSAGYSSESTFALGPLAGPLHTSSTSPGTYWVHTNLEDKHYCADSLVAEGSNLAREPLTIGVSGSTAPLMLNLRDDCAKLTLTLAPEAQGSGVGEEPFYTVYAVPDFDSTEDVIPQTLRPSTGAKVTLDGLTPGSYHVYAFGKPVAFAYREKAIRDALPNRGQAIDLAPGQSANLTVEAPRQ